MSAEPVAVDPALQAIIKRAGAPVTGAPTIAPPSDMPGEEGVINGLRFLIGAGTKGVASSLARRERYGDIYRVQFRDRAMVCVWDADLIHQIAQNTDRLWSAALGWNALGTRGLVPDSGNLGGLLSQDFEDHKAARKVVQPGFTLKAIDGYLVSAGRIVDEIIPGWVARGRVDFKTEGRALLARVATHNFLGLTDPAEISRIDRALGDFFGALRAVARNRVISPKFRRAQDGLRTLFATLRALVPAKRRSEGTDLLSNLCRGLEPGDAADEQMVRIFSSVMIAAYNTTSASLASMMYFLAKHPEWQRRLREEHAKIDEGSGGALDSTSMKTLKQTEWAWKETLRLMPVGSLLPRVALRDVDLGGYRLRAGTFVAAMIAGVGRHPKWWKNPDSFDPERFSPERAEDRQHPGIYLPFGAGAHACIGMQLANMEVKVFLHKLLALCTFSLEEDYEARHTQSPLGSVSGKVRLRLRATQPS